MLSPGWCTGTIEVERRLLSCGLARLLEKEALRFYEQFDIEGFNNKIQYNLLVNANIYILCPALACSAGWSKTGTYNASSRFAYSPIVELRRRTLQAVDFSVLKKSINCHTEMGDIQPWS
jgi:hypothetical protein